MKFKNPFFFIITLFMVACCPCGEQATTPQQFNFNPSQEELSRLVDLGQLAKADSLARSFVEEGVMPQFVTFFSKNGVVIHHKAYGYADYDSKKPVSLNSIFRNASQTKAVVAAGLMILFEEGRFRLDDAVKKYIPSFENPQVLVDLNLKDTTYTTRPAKGDITIRQLFTHTSGISYGGLEGDPWRAIFTKHDVPYAFTNEPLTTQEVISRLGRMPLKFDPGTQYGYGMNIDVIGALIEVLSGQKLSVFMKERMFDPLGMTSTYFVLPESEEDRLVTLYSRTEKGGKLVKNEDSHLQRYMLEGPHTFDSGGGGLVGTIEDYARFCQMLLNGGSFNNHRILGRKTVELMRQNHAGKLYGENGYGLSFEVKLPEGACRDILSVGSFEWAGMYNTSYVVDPQENVVCISYTNIFPNIGSSHVNSRYRTMMFTTLK